jgi:hypothetical protein
MRVVALTQQILFSTVAGGSRRRTSRPASCTHVSRIQPHWIEPASTEDSHVHKEGVSRVILCPDRDKSLAPAPGALVKQQTDPPVGCRGGFALEPRQVTSCSPRLTPNAGRARWQHDANHSRSSESRMGTKAKSRSNRSIRARTLPSPP